MFKQSENVTIAVVSLSSCCWPASRGVVYELIGSKFMLLHVHCTNSWHTARDCLDFLWVCELTVVHISHIIPWLWHHTYNILYTCHLWLILLCPRLTYNVHVHVHVRCVLIGLYFRFMFWSVWVVCRRTVTPAISWMSAMWRGWVITMATAPPCPHRWRASARTSYPREGKVSTEWVA